MTNVETSYFFPPQWNFHVGGPIALGNILSNPKEPQDSINDDDKEALPKLIIDDTKPNFKAVITTKAAVSAGVSSSLLQLFGFSADVNIERSKKRTYTIEAQTLHVQEINPKPLYVEKCLKRPDVADYLDRYDVKRLYMIVGIMAVTAATVSTEMGKKNLFESKLGASFVAGGTPLDANVHGSVRNEKETDASFGESDFILGYKLREIGYLKEKNKVGKMNILKKGTVMNDEEGKGEVVDAEAGGEMELKLIRLEEDRVGANDFELVGLEGEVSSGKDEAVVDVVEFVIPTHQDEANDED